MIKRTGFFILIVFFLLLVVSFQDSTTRFDVQFPVDVLPGPEKPREQWGTLVENFPNNIGNTFTSNPQTTRTITWQSTLGTGEVIIGDTHFASTATLRGNFYFHRVDVSGLTAGETYSYIAGTKDYYSPVFSFSTGNFTGDFTIIHITDPQIGDSNNRNDAVVWKRVIEAARNTCPEAVFVVNTGDIVNNAREASVPFYFDYAQQIIAELPFFYSMGNNDSTSWYNRYFYTPDNIFDGLLYSFDYGNVHFVNIDSNITLTTAQLDWLENDLGTSAQKWKAAMTHQGDYGRSGRNTAITRLFDQYNVDLVMIGHNHFYARSRPINAAGREKQNGTVWIMPNTSGTKFNTRSFQSYLVRDEQPNLPMFSVIRFTETNIFYNSYTVNTSGTVVLFDTYTFR